MSPGSNSEDPFALDVVFESRMSDADALMWNIEKDPALRSTIVSVMMFDAPLEREAIRRRINRLSRAVPRLRQRVRSNPLSMAPPRWEVDPNFDLDYHLRFSKASGAGTLDDVLRIAHPIAMQGFDRARPLWECTVVDGLEGDASALIMKVHHAITDGVGGMKLQLELLDLDRNAEPRPMPPAPDAIVMSQPERFVDAFEHEMNRGARLASRAGLRVLSGVFGAIADPAGAMESANELAASVGRLARPTSHPLSELMTGRSLSVAMGTVTMPLDLAKKAAATTGGRLNDAFVTAITLGIAHYHEELGAPCDRLRMAIPISVRASNLGNTAGNSFIPARIDLAIESIDPSEMMSEVRSLVLHARDEPANDLVDYLSNTLNRLPTSLTTAFFGSVVKGTDFTASNVPGAPIDVFIEGARMTSQFAFGPLAGAAINVTLVSYLNDCNIGINMDPAAVTDPKLMLECISRGIDEVLATVQ